jgi:glycosyltransferase involved in cell wall biosynthesis
MNVVTDAGVIGLAQLFETARTGIYRVISSLSLELLAMEDLEIFYTSLSSLQVHRLTDRYFAEHGFSDRGFEASVFERMLRNLAGCETQSPQEGPAAKVLSRLHRFSLTRAIGCRADIFHSQYAPLPVFPSANPPVRMLTIYDIIPLLHPEYFADGFAEEFRPVVSSFSPDRDFIFTISRCSKDDICAYFNMDPDRVFVTPPAASRDLYMPVENRELIRTTRKKFHIPEGRYFLTLATVEKRKNLATSLKSFRTIVLEGNHEDLCFVLVGTRGWKVQEIYDEIQQDPLLRDRVILTGFVPDSDLSALYSGATAFVYPSLYEGFGLPPLEAMQCGLPVIVSNTSSLPEVVGDAGILVDPEDADGLCRAMLSLLDDEELRQTLVQKGLERAAGFSWRRCAELTVQGYRTAWEGR